jgi:hypothetical protein
LHRDLQAAPVGGFAQQYRETAKFDTALLEQSILQIIRHSYHAVGDYNAFGAPTRRAKKPIDQNAEQRRERGDCSGWSEVQNSERPLDRGGGENARRPKFGKARQTERLARRNYGVEKRNRLLRVWRAQRGRDGFDTSHVSAP